jgi:import receptor subunit TOM70
MEFENKKLKDENKSFREARDKNIFNEQIRNKNIEEIVKDKQILENMINEYEKELKIELLFRRGRKYAFHENFTDCKIDIEEALTHLEDLKSTKEFVMKNHIDARIWEWSGMFRHLCHDLSGASRCYESCLELEPDNVEILVKIAGVVMDDGKYDDAMSYFDKALSFDPTATDALLHRANLFLLQKMPLKAKADLIKCLELRPDYSIARLRLATVLMTTEEVSEAQKCLDVAANIDPQSSEVRSYLGEMYFSRGDFAEARREFELAIKYDPENPTAYFNAALVVINSPPVGGGAPNISEAVALLEKAIKVDPHFHQAYVHLGQLKLSMAMDLTGAKKVVSLYDKGLGYCRRNEEMKDIISMKILAIAQIEAASILKMDTFTMQ